MAVTLSLVVFLAVVAIFVGLDRAINQPSVIDSRLDRYASRPGVNAELAAKEANTIAGRLNRMIVSPTLSKQIELNMARADMKLRPAEYVLLNIATTLGGFVAGLMLARGNWLIALAGLVVGFYAPRFYVRYLESKRLQAFNNQLGDTLLLLANSLRSGYSLLQSMETASKELPAPISTEFERVTREIGLGLTTEEGLAHLLERINSDDLDLIITAINIQHEVGGNLAEILDTISHTIRERVRIKGQIRALTSMQRASGLVVAILPIALGFVIFLLNPNYMSSIFSHICGILMLVTGAIMVITGFIAIQKITNIEV
jgi:tight adherence protein B